MCALRCCREWAPVVPPGPEAHIDAIQHPVADTVIEPDVRLDSGMLAAELVEQWHEDGGKRRFRPNDAQRASYLILGLACQEKSPVQCCQSGPGVLERELHGRLERFASTVSTIVENMPTPVAVVDRNTERILLANEALLAEFGAIAGVGQPFPRLFVDPANWSAVHTTHTDEAIPMLARDGTRHMLTHCTQLEFAGKATGSGTLLITLVDVSHQQQMLKQLRTEADFDLLTGLANRRYFERAAQKAVTHARQRGSPLSVLALDLDFFKRVNDTYGHAAGDRVLQVVARLFERVLRDTDLAARIGGEEFAAILLDTPLEQALAIAERIRATVQNTPIILEGGQTISQTVSIGIAAYSEGEADLVPTHERADAASYGARGAGRNRVQIFVPDTSASPEDDHASPLS